MPLNDNDNAKNFKRTSQRPTALFSAVELARVVAQAFRGVWA